MLNLSWRDLMKLTSKLQMTIYAWLTLLDVVFTSKVPAGNPSTNFVYPKDNWSYTKYLSNVMKSTTSFLSHLLHLRFRRKTFCFMQRNTEWTQKQNLRHMNTKYIRYGSLIILVIGLNYKLRLHNYITPYHNTHYNFKLYVQTVFSDPLKEI